MWYKPCFFFFFFQFLLHFSYCQSVLYISQCISAQSLSHVRFFGTPWTVALQVPLSMEFPRQEYWNILEYWSGCPFLSAGDLPYLWIKSVSLASPSLVGRILITTREVPYIPISSVQSLSRVRLFATPWITAHQASLSITNSRSSLKLMSIKSVMPSRHLILCRPLLLLPPIPLSIRVFFNESTLHMRWPKYWSFSFSISPSNEHPGLISFRMD